MPEPLSPVATPQKLGLAIPELRTAITALSTRLTSLRTSAALPRGLTPRTDVQRHPDGREEYSADERIRSHSDTGEELWRFFTGPFCPSKRAYDLVTDTLEIRERATSTVESKWRLMGIELSVGLAQGA